MDGQDSNSARLNGPSLSGPRLNGPKLNGRIRGRRGIALLSVLWVLMLLGLMAATFTYASRTETKLARNLLESAKAESLADSGLSLTIAHLVQPVAAGGWLLDGQVHSGRLDGGEFRAKIADEAGKIDLNAATADLLRALFVAAGLDGGDAAGLADAIIDFRDPDKLRGLNGAEDDDYSAADLGHDAKDSPFQSVDELKQVIGMPAELYARIAPVLTVHTRQRRPNEAAAPPLVVAALSGRALDDMGQSETPGSSGQSSDDLGLANPDDSRSDAERGDVNAVRGARSRIGIYAVRVEGRTSNGALVARDVVLRLTRRPDAPARILEWREARPILFALSNTEDPVLEP